MSCNSIVCGVFEVDFEMSVVGIKVPSSLLQRGIRKGTVTVDFGDVIGPPKTAKAVESQPSTAPNTGSPKLCPTCGEEMTPSEYSCDNGHYEPVY